MATSHNFYVGYPYLEPRRRKKKKYKCSKCGKVGHNKRSCGRKRQRRSIESPQKTKKKKVIAINDEKEGVDELYITDECMICATEYGKKHVVTMFGCCKQEMCLDCYDKNIESYVGKTSEPKCPFCRIKVF